MLLFLLLTGRNIPPSLTIPNVPLTFFLNIHTSRENGLHMLNYLKALAKPAKFHSGSRKKTALVVKYVRMVF